MNIPITKPALGEEEARAPYGAIKSGWVTQGPKVADARERGVQSGRTRRRRDAVGRPDIRRDRLLELGDLRPLRPPPALDRSVGRAGLLLAERGFGDRDVHLLARFGRHACLLLDSRAGKRPAPPGDELPQTVGERRRRAESEHFLGPTRVAVA